MPQADFAYAPALDPVDRPLGVTVYADRAAVLADLMEGVAAAGIAVRHSGSLADLLEAEPMALGEVVLVDCPQVDGRALAALARLDARAARSGAQLLISTAVAALDDVFGACDQADLQLLVDPSPADRVIALGRALLKAPHLRLRELAEDERLTLLRLTEQVGQIARRLDRLGAAEPALVGDDKVFRLESPSLAFVPAGTGGDRLVRSVPRPTAPDPRLARTIIRQRQLRARFFEAELFADPAWDMLLDLTAAREEHQRVSVTSLCLASGVPPTTALRWIGQMTEAGLLVRVDDPSDRRRAFIALSDRAAEAMARYFAEIGHGAASAAAA